MASEPQKSGNSTLDALLGGRLNRDTYNADLQKKQMNQEKALVISSGESDEEEELCGALQGLRPPSDDELSDEFSEDSVVGIDSESDEIVPIQPLEPLTGDEDELSEEFETDIESELESISDEEDVQPVEISSSSEKIEEIIHEETVEVEETEDDESSASETIQEEQQREEKLVLPTEEKVSTNSTHSGPANLDQNSLPDVSKLDSREPPGNTVPTETIGLSVSSTEKTKVDPQTVVTETPPAAIEKTATKTKPIRDTSTYDEVINYVAEKYSQKSEMESESEILKKVQSEPSTTVEADSTEIKKPKLKKVRKKKSNVEDGSADETSPTKSKKKQSAKEEESKDGSSPQKKKRKKKRPKTEEGEEETGDGSPKKKRRRKKKKEDHDGDDEEKKKKKLYERRNIRKIIKDEELDAETLEAQQEEERRRKRVQEIQEQRLQELKEQKRLEREIFEAQFEGENDASSDSGQNSELRMLLEKSEDTSKAEETQPKKVAEDVIDISSDEDDVMMVQSPVEEDDDDDEEDDPNNCGLHTNDAMNQPNWMGQVLVNVGHPPEDPDIYLAPQLSRAVKPHQIGGIRFLYDNMVESLDRVKTSNGLGCILAHSMGLGKTIQMVSFIDVILRHSPMKTVLCIVPINTLQNWVHEFNMWLPVKKEVKPEKPAPSAPKDDISTNMSIPNIAREESNMSMASTLKDESVSNMGIANMTIKDDSISNFSMASTANNSIANSFTMPPSFKDDTASNFSMTSTFKDDTASNFSMASSIKDDTVSNMSMASNVKNDAAVSFNIPSVGTAKDNISNNTNTENATAPSENTKEGNNASETKEERNGENTQQGEPEITYRQFPVHCVNDSHKTMASRAKVVREWSSKGGVLLMGYEMYRLLCSRRIAPSRSRKSKKNNEPVVIDIDEEERNKDFLQEIHGALMRPGPDLVVCDEGHRIKNSHAGISQALKNIRTRRRVVLTGYPLQNNLMEYWCMVDFVRPNFLGTKTEFSNMFERPITNGQCVDSTPQDHRLMKFRAHVLHSLLEGFVQRRGHAVLQCALLPKQEYVILVRMSPIQRQLYAFFMQSMMDNRLLMWANNNPLKAFAVCCKIWNHPDVLYKILKEEKKIDDDLDIADDAEASGKKKGAKAPASKSGSGASSRSQSPVNGANKMNEAKSSPVRNPIEASLPLIAEKKEVITYDWAQTIMKDYTPGLLENGGKMLILADLIEETLKAGDKLLIFSQSLFTLNLVEEFLSKMVIPIPGETSYWTKNKSYFRLDGSTSSSEREKLINQFNSHDNENIRLFLLSTRAGCLGINLTGANRVVVMDASWNPCHDCQAVCRVYRYGQQKPCFVYRLVTDNTMEKKIYDRQINKQGMSDRVVDELQPQNQFSRRQVDNLLQYDDIDLPELDVKEFEERFNNQDQVLLNIVRRHSNWITKLPFTHESLLLDRKDQKLTKAEKRLAKQSYEQEKKLNISYTRPSYSSFYPSGERGPGFNPAFPMGLSNRCSQMPNPKRPVASVRPMMSTPHPMHGGNQAAKPGVTVQQIQTTTDITIPGTNSSTVAGKIPSGENVLVIKTPKGVYIRTKEGKIFAVRSGPQAAGLQGKNLLTGGTSTPTTRPPPYPGTSGGSGSHPAALGRSASQPVLGSNNSTAGNFPPQSTASSRAELLQSAAALLAKSMPDAANMLTASQPLAPSLPKPDKKESSAIVDLSSSTQRKKKPSPSIESLLAEEQPAPVPPTETVIKPPATTTTNAEKSQPNLPNLKPDMSLSDMLNFDDDTSTSNLMDTDSNSKVDSPKPQSEPSLPEEQQISQQVAPSSAVSTGEPRKSEAMSFDDLFDDILSTSPGSNLPTAKDLLGDPPENFNSSAPSPSTINTGNKSTAEGNIQQVSTGNFGPNPLEHLASIANNGPSNIGPGVFSPMNNPWASVFGGAPSNTTASNMNIPPYPPHPMYSYYPPYPYMPPTGPGAPPPPWGYPPMFMPPNYGMPPGMNQGTSLGATQQSSHENHQPNPPKE